MFLACKVKVLEITLKKSRLVLCLKWLSYEFSVVSVQLKSLISITEN